MGSDNNLRLGVAEWGRIKRAALFHIIRRGGVELGEIARIESRSKKYSRPLPLRPIAHVGMHGCLRASHRLPGLTDVRSAGWREFLALMQGAALSRCQVL
jgi:hypothetical protein